MGSRGRYWRPKQSPILLPNAEGWLLSVSNKEGPRLLHVLVSFRSHLSCDAIVGPVLLKDQRNFIAQVEQLTLDNLNTLFCSADDQLQLENVQH